jgi:hypothetical protein
MTSSSISWHAKKSAAQRDEAGETVRSHRYVEGFAVLLGAPLWSHEVVAGDRPNRRAATSPSTRNVSVR